MAFDGRAKDGLRVFWNSHEGVRLMPGIFHGEAKLREHFPIQPFQVEMRQRSMYELETQGLGSGKQSQTDPIWSLG